jgi:ABC-type bacteriocin/lantibiotic exporter with double-glycine peptidase domain
MPLGISPYPYIFVFAVLHFLTSGSGIPSVTKILVSRLGANGDEALSSRYTDHLLGLAVGSSKAKSSNDLHAATATGAVSKVLQTVSVLVAAVDDALIGAIVLGVLFGWEFGFIVLVVLGIYGMFSTSSFVLILTTSRSA